jgi:L,D-transpeptidase ErfK/SrfK
MSVRSSRSGWFSGLLLAVGSSTLLSTAGPMPVSASLSGRVSQHVVAAGETLATIGARAGVDRAVLARANGIPAQARLRPGNTLAVDNRHIVPLHEGEVLLVNIPQRMLFRFEGGAFVVAYPVAVGRPDWPTPVGAFTIAMKEEDPCWDVPVSIQEELRRAGKPAPTCVPPGPANPLGAHWLGTSLPAIGIHGTPQPGGIYRAASHGCIRVHPDDVAQLFEQVPVGAAGRIVYAPVLLARTDDGVFLEAHPDVYGRDRSTSIATVREWAAAGGLTDAIDWERARNVLAAREGIARDVGGT